MEKQVYVLLDLENLSHIHAPLRSTQRIKYTCFCVSQKLLVFGATSGGLYVFKREPCSFQQLIPSKDGPVSCISVSSDEGNLAYATTRGLVVVIELQGTCRRLQVSQEHIGAEVTALQWGDDCLYAGDSLGRVSLCTVFSFSAKTIFQTPSVQLMQLDSAVVQLSWYNEALLLSTLTRCYVSDTRKEQYKPVGQKLRDGAYGACFLPQEAALRIFCARPGCRLWEVQEDGSVLSTHQFRPTLANTPASPLVGNKVKQSQLNSKQQFNFTKLYPLSNKFVFSYEQDGLYILDPDNAEVVIWTDDLTDIQDAQIVNDTMYVWRSCGTMHAITLSSVEKSVMRLYFRKHYALCAQICANYKTHLLRDLPSSRKLHIIADLGEKLAELGLAELQQKILPLLAEVTNVSPERPRSQKLRSGIYLVGNGHAVQNDDKPPGRCRKISERSRSLSSSPDGRRRRKPGLKHSNLSGSTQSLNEAGKPSKEPVGGVELPFSVLTSPESIVAIRELTQVLSVKFTSGTKTLREKWHALEDKVRSLSQDCPMPLDVGKYRETSPPREHHDYETVLPNGRKIILKQIITYPALDVNPLLEACKLDPLDEQLLTALCDFCTQFYKIKENSDKHWLQYNVKEPVPYEHYFNGNIMITIESYLINQLKTKSILKFLEKWLGSAEVDKDIPEIFRKIYTEEDIKFDILLSRFIMINSLVLNAEHVLCAIDTFPCSFVSWCSVLNHFQQDVLTFVTSESRENIRRLITDTNYPLPKLLNVMYLVLRVSSVEGIDICLTIGERVSVRHFCYVVLKLQQQKTSESPEMYIRRYCQNIFLSYLTKLISSGKDIKEECLHDEQVLMVTLTSFLEANCKPDGTCCCGFPQPGALRTAVLQFEALGALLLQHFKDNDEKEYLSLCGKLGLWREVITEENCVPFIVQLDSPALLNEADLSKESRCVELLRVKAVMDCSRSCFNCGAYLKQPNKWNLTWSYLGMTLVKRFGANKACDLMLLHVPSHVALDEKFYQACLFSEMVTSEDHKAAVVKFLQKSTSQQLQLFSPQVAGLVAEALSRDLALQGQFISAEIPAGDTGNHHWGIQGHIKGAQCPRCTLSLSDKVLLKSGGVKVFPCGHALHAVCIRASTCVICDNL